jgi:cell cycle protein kinase DBF2
MPPPRSASPVKGTSNAAHHVPGLPIAQGNDYDFYHDVRMDTAKGLTATGLPDIHMNTARGYTMGPEDINMDTARGTLKPGGFKMWEIELLESPEIRRKGTVAQLCTFDHDLS